MWDSRPRLSGGPDVSGRYASRCTIVIQTERRNPLPAPERDDDVARASPLASRPVARFRSCRGVGGPRPLPLRILAGFQPVSTLRHQATLATVSEGRLPFPRWVAGTIHDRALLSIRIISAGTRHTLHGSDFRAATPHKTRLPRAVTAGCVRLP